MEQSKSSGETERASPAWLNLLIERSVRPLAHLTKEEQDSITEGLVNTYSHLSEEAQRHVAKQLGLQPEQSVVNYVWKVIITSLAAVLIVSVITLAIGLLLGRQATELQIMLTVFTTVAAFFAGLLSPSPTHNK